MADEMDDLVTILPLLLRALAGLEFVSRYLNPAAIGPVLSAVGEPDAPLREILPRMETWPERMNAVKSCLQEASTRAFNAYEGLREAGAQPDGMRGLYRALGQLPRAQEALYPLAGDLPPVSRYFLTPEARQDEAKLAALAAGRRDDAGVFHVGDEPGARGSFSLYVPEDYSPDRPAPVVFALHGGAGNGRNFLWSWLREARSRGAILVAPTAIGETWALMGPDIDTPNLKRMLDQVRSAWAIDETRLLMTGMSDGGTFSYVSGRLSGSPFTHLAPACASFHPILAQMADAERLQGLPIHITHGALDWMFPVQVGREASDALAAAGAAVTYLEIDDLSHTYPREVNTPVLDWLGA
jgi:phospholipase/carboxylesterase